jgi:hypothetical protein
MISTCEQHTPHARALLPTTLASVSIEFIFVLDRVRGDRLDGTLPVDYLIQFPLGASGVSEMDMNIAQRHASGIYHVKPEARNGVGAQKHSDSAVRPPAGLACSADKRCRALGGEVVPSGRLERVHF